MLPRDMDCRLPAAAAHAFDLQGHRGARGLMPENTLEGFAATLAHRRDDARARSGDDQGRRGRGQSRQHLNPDHTRGPDGAFLQAHGPAIRSLTLAELKRYDVGRLKPGTAYAATFSEQRAVDGATIPTLAEVFDLVRSAKADHVRFNIETKLTPTSGADVADPETFAAAVVERGACGGPDRTGRGPVLRLAARSRSCGDIAPEIERVCITIDGY